MRIIIGLALLAASATPAFAGFHTGSHLSEWCGSDDERLGLCAGYVSGVADTAELLDTPYFCAPDGVQVGQMVDVVDNYISANPEKRHLPGQGLVMVALAKAFPCS